MRLAFLSCGVGDRVGGGSARDAIPEAYVIGGAGHVGSLAPPYNTHESRESPKIVRGMYIVA